MRTDLVLSLLKHQLIASKPLEQFISSPSKRKNKNSVVSTIVRIVGILFISASFIILFASNYFGYLKLGTMMDLVEESIAFCMFTSTLFLLFISTTYLEHTYFRGKDVQLWRLLPIDKSSFFLARFFVNYTYSLLLNLIVTIPLIVAIFYYVGFSFYILFTALILFFLLPIIPLLISSLLVVLKIHLTKGKNIKIVDFLFNNAPFLAGVLYLSRSSSNMIEVAFEGGAADQMVAIFNYISTIGNIPYFNLYGSSFFSFISLILLVIVAICVFILSLFIISPLFDKCMILITKAKNSDNRVKKNVDNVDEFKSSSIFRSLVKRELYILKSQKGFLSESISEMLIPIILIVVWQISGSLGDISQMIVQFSSSSHFIAIIFTIVSLFGAMILISSTSVSREGSLFVLNKILPIDIKMIIRAKIVFHLLFMTVIQVLYLIVFCFIFNIPFYNLSWMIPLFIINSINVSLIGLIIDYSNPKLDWDVGIAAMKRNINGMLGMLGGVIVIAPSHLILFFLSDYYYLSIVISLAILFVLNYYVEKVATKAVSAN